MPRRKYTNDEIPQLVAQFKDREFTIPMLRDAYVEKSADKGRSVKAIQHSIYKTLLKMEAKGELSRLPKRFGRTDAYVWNDSKTSAQKEVSSEEIAPHRSRDICIDHESLLKERLTRHKSDLIAVVGEAKEYEALSVEFPEMAVGLQQRYNVARDTISTLLGRIRALEGVLTERQAQ